MNERIAKTTATQVSATEGYNFCPKCGRQVYTVHTEEQYLVGCVHCGLKSGVSTLLDEGTPEDFENKMRIAWNETCLSEEYEEDALEAMNLVHGGYVIVSNADGKIVHVTEDFAGVEAYLTVTGDSLSYGIYMMLAGKLQYLGCTFLMWLMQQSQNKTEQ